MRRKARSADVHFIEARDIGRREAEDGIFQEENRDQRDYARDQRKERAFGDELACEAGTAGAQREADGDFAAASGSAREQKVGDIYAGDQQDKSYCSEKDEEFGALWADEIFFHGNEAKRPTGRGGIVFRITAAELQRVSVELSLRLRDGEPGLQARDRSGNDSLRPIGGNGKRRAVESGGAPNFDVGVERAAGMTEAGGHHADDGVEVRIEAHFAADDVRIRTVIAAPETVADYDRLDKAGDGVLLGVNAAELRLRAEQREIIRAGDEAFGADGALSATDRGIGGSDRGNFLENSGAVLQIP